MGLLSLVANVVFVGQSLLGQPLPDMVAAALRQMGEPALVEAQISTGGTLAEAWDAGQPFEGVNARERLVAHPAEVLILADAVPEAATAEGLVAAVVRFGDLAVAGDPQVRLYLFETWRPLKDAGAWRAALHLDLPVWESVARDAGARLGHPVQLIPAGQAMGQLSDAIASGQVAGLTSLADVLNRDGSPTPKGWYFLTMLQAAAISGQSPVGLPAKLTRSWPSRDAVISEELAAALQAIAWRSLQSYVPGAAPEGAAQAAAKTDLPDFAPITNRNLALNLAPVNDWSVAQPFLDVMKTARPWIGHLPGQWGGWEHDDLARAGALGPGGWPQRIPPEITAISTLILTDLPETAGGVAGRYRLSYQGNGTLEIAGRAEVVEASPGQISFDYSPGEGAVVLTLSAIDAQDPIRNITVVKAAQAEALAAGAVFNPDWLARLRGVKGLRFMDWMATNGSALVTVQDRPLPADYSYARRGVPVEVLLALANELQADPWFTLPHQADDGLVRLYAQIVQDGLTAGLTASVEYSNEVWNGALPQAQWAEAQARARWGQDKAGMQYYGLRAAQVAAIWADVFQAAPGRLRRVVATQTGWPGLEQQILNPPLVLAEGGAPPGPSFDLYAVSAGFTGMLGSDDNRNLIKGWLAQSEQAALEQIAAAGLTGAEAAAYLEDHRYDLADRQAAAQLRDAPDGISALLTQTLPYHAGIAAEVGMKLAMYEGGSHVVAFGTQPSDPALTAFFVQLSYSPEMAALYAEVMAGWQSLSDQAFTATGDVATPGAWGSWGALRHLGDDSARWQVLAKGCLRC